MIKVALVEDNPNIRSFVADYLEESKEFEFLIASETAEDFLEGSKLGPAPEVLLLDINLPGMSGLEAIRAIKGRFPEVEIIMFTIHDDSDFIFKALCAGGSGYLLKSTPLPRIKESIHQVHRGQAAISPSIARKVIEYFRPQKKQLEELTPREMQIVQCMVDGLSYKLIADKLMVSINTVCYHVKNIYRKLQVNSKAEVIARTLKKGPE